MGPSFQWEPLLLSVGRAWALGAPRAAGRVQELQPRLLGPVPRVGRQDDPQAHRAAAGPPHLQPAVHRPAVAPVSLSERAAVDHGEVGFRSQLGRQPLFDTGWPIPVSYTHLTL